MVYSVCFIFDYFYRVLWNEDLYIKPAPRDTCRLDWTPENVDTMTHQDVCRPPPYVVLSHLVSGHFVMLRSHDAGLRSLISFHLVGNHSLQ